jgi:hypothetical protein
MLFAAVVNVFVCASLTDAESAATCAHGDGSRDVAVGGSHSVSTSSIGSE